MDGSFLKSFEKELVSRRSHQAYSQVAQRRGFQVPPSQLPQALDTQALLAEILSASGDVCHDIVSMVRQLKAAGLRTGALTNDVQLGTGWLSEGDTGRWRALEALLKDSDVFDVVVSSCRIGARKPERRAYEVVCERLGVGPQDVMFFDDIGRNCKAAREFGMQTMLVKDEDGRQELKGALARLLDEASRRARL